MLEQAISSLASKEQEFTWCRSDYFSQSCERVMFQERGCISCTDTQTEIGSEMAASAARDRDYKFYVNSLKSVLWHSDKKSPPRNGIIKGCCSCIQLIWHTITGHCIVFLCSPLLFFNHPSVPLSFFLSPLSSPHLQCSYLWRWPCAKSNNYFWRSVFTVRAAHYNGKRFTNFPGSPCCISWQWDV